jgi:prepilin-type N-terminal cleavage/methylation domain-containing protein
MKPSTSILKLSRLQQHRVKNSTDTGYTLLELLMVIIIIGILAVISGAGFLGWMQRLRVSAARDEVYTGLREAQSRARQQNDSWQFSIRDNNGNVQWAVHPARVAPTAWKTIEQRGVIIDDRNTDPSGQIWDVEFDNKGLVVGNLGKITLSGDAGGYKRCVEIRTLLGAMSTREDDECEN